MNPSSRLRLGAAALLVASALPLFMMLLTSALRPDLVAGLLGHAIAPAVVAAEALLTAVGMALQLAASQVAIRPVWRALLSVVGLLFFTLPATFIVMLSPIVVAFANAAPSREAAHRPSGVEHPRALCCHRAIHLTLFVFALGVHAAPAIVRRCEPGSEAGRNAAALVTELDAAVRTHDAGAKKSI